MGERGKEGRVWGERVGVGKGQGRGMMCRRCAMGNAPVTRTSTVGCDHADTPTEFATRTCVSRRSAEEVLAQANPLTLTVPALSST